MKTTNVHLNNELIEKANGSCIESNRSVSAQIEHWARIGAVMEDNPDLTYEFVKQVMVGKAEKDDGKLESYQFS
ncbi:MAG: hypothetical protein HRT35_33165 [Algicola sp.]|nr:hypothetical protein [Algicola sp.]